MTDDTHEITVNVNGANRSARVPARMTLADFLREKLDMTGTHVGCEHGVCGACTVLVDGASVRACLLFAVQAEGSEVRTVEGLADEDGKLHAVQRAFCDKHGLQCGFCTPGLLMASSEILDEVDSLTRDEIRERIGGNLCRCTGYHNIVDSIEEALRLKREETNV